MWMLAYFHYDKKKKKKTSQMYASLTTDTSNTAEAV